MPSASRWALDDLRRAAPDLRLDAAVLDDLDRQYEPSCDEDDVALAEPVGDARCGADPRALGELDDVGRALVRAAETISPYRPQRMTRAEKRRRSSGRVS